VIYDVDAIYGTNDVRCIEDRTRHEIDFEASQGFRQATRLQHAHLMTVVEESSNEHVAKAAATTSY
jgi:hypothetical protein